jgi:hypothetical protein
VERPELAALRRLLFFSAAEAADFIGRVNEQAWHRWEEGSRPVPDDVAERILDLVAWRHAQIEAASARIADVPANADIPSKARGARRRGNP